MKTDEFLRTRPGSGMHGREHPAGRPCIGCSGVAWRYSKKAHRPLGLASGIKSAAGDGAGSGRRGARLRSCPPPACGRLRLHFTAPGTPTTGSEASLTERATGCVTAAACQGARMGSAAGSRWRWPSQTDSGGQERSCPPTPLGAPPPVVGSRHVDCDWVSVSEMPHAAEHHGHAALVGGGDHLGVAHRAAGLDDAGGAVVDHHVQPIAEREERVAGHGRALQ